MIGNDADSYANWLGTKIGGGDAFVGKKAYHSGNNSTDLSSAFTEVLDMIKESAFRAMYEPELTADPMGEHIEFLGFYNKSGKFVDVKKQSTLTGSHTENGENSVSYASQINWDLLNSGYTLTKTGSGLSRYVYTLKYRVRLENELDDFIENQFYDTNGTTTLTYKTPEGKEKTLEYPKPQVEGYLTHLQFTKQNDAGKALAGAEFSLTHNKTVPFAAEPSPSLSSPAVPTATERSSSDR